MRLAGTSFLLIFVRMIPPIVITLPLFPVVNFLGLSDTHLVLILLYSACFVGDLDHEGGDRPDSH